MRRVILHVGIHKTGTTSIQGFLDKNWEVLKENNVLYPLAGRQETYQKNHVSHHKLAWSVVSWYSNKYKFNKSDEYWTIMNHEIEKENPELIILSSEFFWRALIEEIKQIKSYLERYDVQVLLYFRNPLDYAVSGYKQDIKTGKTTQDFYAYVKERTWQYDFDATITRWQSVFGKNAIKIRIFEKVKSNLIEDFVKLVGIDKFPLIQNVETRNVSPSDAVIHMIRMLNILDARTPNSFDSIIARVRRNIVRGSSPGRILSRLADTFIKAPILNDSDAKYLESITKDLKSRFLDKHVINDDHIYFENRYLKKNLLDK